MNKEQKTQVKGNEVNNAIPKRSLAQPLEGSLNEGLNLMPSMTKEEKVIETTKSTFNIGSALSLIFLVVVSFLIVGFNILSNKQLSDSKQELYKQEKIINDKLDKIVANNSIVDRVVMYKDVYSNSFSHKQVVEFIKGITNKAGNISLKSIEVSDNLKFEFSGSAPTFEEVSKLWYLLGVNDNIETVNLESVGKGDNESRFTFEGQLKSNTFFRK